MVKPAYDVKNYIDKSEKFVFNNMNMIIKPNELEEFRQTHNDGIYHYFWFITDNYEQGGEYNVVTTEKEYNFHSRIVCAIKVSNDCIIIEFFSDREDIVFNEDTIKSISFKANTNLSKWRE